MFNRKLKNSVTKIEKNLENVCNDIKYIDIRLLLLNSKTAAALKAVCLINERLDTISKNLDDIRKEISNKNSKDGTYEKSTSIEIYSKTCDEKEEE